MEMGSSQVFGDVQDVVVSPESANCRGGGGGGEREWCGSGNSGQGLYFQRMLSHLSRNGLNMLAGVGSNGDFSLKPSVAFGTSGLRNLGERASVVPVTGGFTEFAGCRAAKAVPMASAARSMSPMGLLFGSPEEMKLPVSEDNGGASVGEKQPEFQKLSTDECWRLILKLGTKWPAWNQAATLSQSPQGLVRECDASTEGSNHGQHPSHKEEGLLQGKEKLSVALHRPQDFLKLLATRALDALAQSPPCDHYGRAAESMRAPKRTTQEVMDSKAAVGDAPKTPTKATEPTPLSRGVPEVRSRAPKASVSSPRPRTAARTTFYDGIVCICDNVPADKAFSQSLKCVTPPSQAVTPSQEGLQRSQSSTQVALLVGTSSGSPPPSCAHLGGTVTSESQESSAAACSNSAKVSISEPPPRPLKVTIPTEDPHSRHYVMVKPLPTARKNSLARFLDSRKRERTSCSEGGSSKKQAFGDCCSPTDQKEVKSLMCSQPKGGVSDNCHQRATPDTEMQNSRVE